MDDPDQTDEVGYDLSEWAPTLRQALVNGLDAGGVAHWWDEDELVVSAGAVEAVDAVMEAIMHPGALPRLADEPGDPMEAVNGWFLGADRLRRDPFDRRGLIELRDALEVAGASPPFGLDKRWWADVSSRAELLLALVATERPPDQVRNQAIALHTLLRPLV